MSRKRGKKSKVHQALEESAALFGRAQHGAFVGQDQDGRVFVGFISKTRACFRFTGKDYEAALYAARAWMSTNASRFEVAAAPEPKYERRPAPPPLTDEEREALGMSSHSEEAST